MVITEYCSFSFSSFFFNARTNFGTLMQAFKARRKPQLFTLFDKCYNLFIHYVFVCVNAQFKQVSVLYLMNVLHEFSRAAF